MNLTPKPWSWSAPLPNAGWLGQCPIDTPFVWLAPLTDDTDILSRLMSVLSAEEQTRVSRFHHIDDQRRSLIGRGLLRILVGAHYNLPARQLNFEFGPQGKPFIAAPPETRPLHFNVSHSGEYAALAFHSDCEVGVDIEEVKPDTDLESIARQFLSADEFSAWSGLEPILRPNAFYQAWTRHEARLKALGLGLGGVPPLLPANPASSFDLVLPAGYQGCVVMLR